VHIHFCISTSAYQQVHIINYQINQTRLLANNSKLNVGTCGNEPPTGDSEMSNSVLNTNSLMAFSDEFDVEIIAKFEPVYQKQVSGPFVGRIAILHVKNKAGDILKTREQRWWYDENGLTEIESIDCNHWSSHWSS
jgi:hypothetical protein